MISKLNSVSSYATITLYIIYSIFYRFNFSKFWIIILNILIILNIFFIIFLIRKIYLSDERKFLRNVFIRLIINLILFILAFTLIDM
jgi:hypothetical protein